MLEGERVWLRETKMPGPVMEREREGDSEDESLRDLESSMK
jgi:hypothetical protein